MKERQKCAFISDAQHSELTGFHVQDIYYARKFVDYDNVAGWLLIVWYGESDTLHLVGTVVINLFLFSRCRAGGEK
jgi:hypothetical protein